MKRVVSLRARSPNRGASRFFATPRNCFVLFGDYVGGRYSVWSPVGCLPLALQYGVRPVRDLLKGARAMDFHFRDAPLAENLPVVLDAQDV